MTRPDVTILLPNLQGGGAERVCVTLARGFVRRHLRVDVVLLNAYGPLLREVPPEAALINLRASRIRHAFRPLVRYLRERQPRSLHAAMWPITCLAIWAVRRARVTTRVVVSDHNHFVYTPYSGPLGRLLTSATIRLSYPAADAVVAVSEGVAGVVSNLSGLPRTRITVVHNPIEVSADELAPHDDMAPDWTREDARRRVIAIGSFKPQKDFSTLLHAFARARQSVDIKLLVLGDGPLRGDLEALVRALGLEHSVQMPGFVEKPERYLRRADLFVLSSAWEGFGNVIVEALACGVPVVSTDCQSGPAEILADGQFGALIEPRNPEALSQGIVAALARSHDAEALMARARQFSAQPSIDRHLALLLPDEAVRST